MHTPFGALVENFQKGLKNLSEGVCEEAITQVVCVLKWKARGMQGQWENNTKQAGRLAPCWAPGEWASSPAMQRNHQTNSTDNLNRVPLPRSPTQPSLHSYATRELSPSITRLFKKKNADVEGGGVTSRWKSTYFGFGKILSLFLWQCIITDSAL